MIRSSEIRHSVPHFLNTKNISPFSPPIQLPTPGEAEFSNEACKAFFAFVYNALRTSKNVLTSERRQVGGIWAQIIRKQEATQ